MLWPNPYSYPIFNSTTVFQIFDISAEFNEDQWVEFPEFLDFFTEIDGKFLHWPLCRGRKAVWNDIQFEGLTWKSVDGNPN